MCSSFFRLSSYSFPRLLGAGDIISVLLDCDAGTLSFARNGHSMGPAFSDIPFGPGIAYCPAASLSEGEALRFNFGATPLVYPEEGYTPVVDGKVTTENKRCFSVFLTVFFLFCCSVCLPLKTVCVHLSYRRCAAC